MFFISAIFQAASAQCAPLWVGCLIPPRRNLTIYNKRCKLPVGDDAFSLTCLGKCFQIYLLGAASLDIP